MTKYKINEAKYHILFVEAECQRYTNHAGSTDSRETKYHLLFRIKIQFEGQVHFYERVKLLGIDLSHSKGQLPVYSVVKICHRCVGRIGNLNALLHVESGNGSDATRRRS